MTSLTRRCAALDWASLSAALDTDGYAITSPVLSARECTTLARLFAQERRFRTTVDMARYRFGSGTYRYFANPLPPLVRALREQLYARLAPLANRWMELLHLTQRFPPSLSAYLTACAAQGQRRPTPLLLRYHAGDYNCLHQDLYGSLAFPLQATILLSTPGRDYRGGEFLLVEQRPRAQSRASVIPLTRGAAVIFPNAVRPVVGSRGAYRVQVRHGVSRVHSGTRLALGIILHDAR